jgi:hypothetical protein
VATDDVLAFLDERWKKPLDITTIGQAQAALNLPHDDVQRQQLYEHLESNPGRLTEKVRFGVSATTVTLTNQEKLAGRALLLGRNEEQARDLASVEPDQWQAAKQMLIRIGLLSVDGWRPAAGHERLLDGVGLLFHTVRTGGDVFNVP